MPQLISLNRARASAVRFINGHFNRPGPKPETQIPARPDEDDDFVLMEYFRQQERASRLEDIMVEIIAVMMWRTSFFAPEVPENVRDTYRQHARDHLGLLFNPPAAEKAGEAIKEMHADLVGADIEG